MPSVLPLRDLVRRSVFRRRVWVVAGLATLAAPALLGAANGQDDKLARLGFKFDQQAHDAAVAARREAGGATLADEPADPDVVRLPKYTVTEDRFPLEERELLTDKGRVDVAMKRYISPLYRKTLGPLSAVASLLANPLGGWAPNTPEAMALYEDDERKRRNARMNELVGLADLSEKLKRPAATKTSEQKSTKNE